MPQEYLKIADDFVREIAQTHISAEDNKSRSEAVMPERPRQSSDTEYEINEINEIGQGVETGESTEPQAKYELHEDAFAATPDLERSIPDSMPALEPVIASDEQLSLVDWRNGLRCGISGRQCLLCRGAPCIGSTAWHLPHASPETE
jgi:hypothetical protein